MENKKKSYLIHILIFAVICFLLLFRLDRFPKLWWDEGWTLSVARNWIENGDFGHYLDNETIPARSPVRFTMVIPIAISFKLFGIGVWQGRLPSVIFTIYTLGFLYYLTIKIYNRRAANFALFILLVMSGLFLNPIYYGRQVLAEMQMLFYIFGGYTLLWLALERSRVFILLASLFWGISLVSKLQVPPFWFLSMSLILLFLLINRAWGKIKILVCGVIGSIFVAAILIGIQNQFIPSLLDDKPLVNILINTTVFVPDWPIRSLAVLYALLFGFPTICGFVAAGGQFLQCFRIATKDTIPGSFSIEADLNKNVVRLGLWGFGVSWLIWFVFLTMSWTRYLFPAFFIGSIFAAVFFQTTTKDFRINLAIHKASSVLLRKGITKTNLYTIFGILVLGYGIGISTISTIILGKSLHLDITNYEVFDYIENQIPTTALIETFESELFFLAPHRYHFPSDLVSMQLVWRESIDPTFEIPYDPLASNPDYLIVGDYSHNWSCYDDVLESGEFQFESELPGYQVYRRIEE